MRCRFKGVHTKPKPYARHPKPSLPRNHNSVLGIRDVARDFNASVSVAWHEARKGKSCVDPITGFRIKSYGILTAKIMVIGGIVRVKSLRVQGCRAVA